MIASFESPVELLLLGLLALIVFGPKRLPEIGRSLGSGVREFRTSMSGISEAVFQDTESADLSESTTLPLPESWSAAPGDGLVDARSGPRRPPEMLDGARVLQFASLAGVQMTGRSRHIVNGVELIDFDALAIARYDDEPESIYLLYCDRDWRVLSETRHDDTADAINHAYFEFGPFHFENL